MLDNTAMYICQNPECLKLWTPVPLSTPVQWKEIKLSRPANPPTGKELEERAREFVAKHALPPYTTSYLTALLTRIRDEARLKEAKLWDEQRELWNQSHIELREFAQERIATLEQSLARAVSKETGR